MLASPMLLHLFRPRSLAVVGGAVVLAAAGLLATSATLLTHMRAPARVVSSAVDLQRPLWFDMRIVAARPGFVAGATTAAATPAVVARAGILIDLDTRTILWQEEAHRPLPPASTAKVMTALVTLANFDLAHRVRVTPAALQQQWDETRMGLTAGEVLRVDELLSGMLLVSGNDAAMALAEDTVGTERFVAAMNAQAAALGMRDSHFANPVGLDDAAEQSSAYDLALLTASVLDRYPSFQSMVAQQALTLAATATHPEFDLTSINLLLSMYPAAVGVKPGWTGNAGYCLIGMAVRDGHRLLSVLLNAPYSYSQSRRLLDWGFVQEGLPSTLPTPSPSPSPRG